MSVEKFRGLIWNLLAEADQGAVIHLDLDRDACRVVLPASLQKQLSAYLSPVLQAVTDETPEKGQPRAKK